MKDSPGNIFQNSANNHGIRRGLGTPPIMTSPALPHGNPVFGGRGNPPKPPQILGDPNSARHIPPSLAILTPRSTPPSLAIPIPQLREALPPSLAIPIPQLREALPHPWRSQSPNSARHSPHPWRSQSPNSARHSPILGDPNPPTPRGIPHPWRSQLREALPPSLAFLGCNLPLPQFIASSSGRRVVAPPDLPDGRECAPELKSRRGGGGGGCAPAAEDGPGTRPAVQGGSWGCVQTPEGAMPLLGCYANDVFSGAGQVHSEAAGRAGSGPVFFFLSFFVLQFVFVFCQLYFFFQFFSKKLFFHTFSVFFQI